VKVLLTGRTGQLGAELERRLAPLGSVLATGRAELDLASGDALRRAVRAAQPDVIVNAAAYTAVARAESERAAAMQVNGAAPGILAEEARALGALLVHYSTDYVFDGAKRSPYAEDDAPNPLNAYGASKLEGERRVRASGCRALLIRTSWLYAPRGVNFYRTIVAKAAAGERLRVVDDQRGVPTPAAFVAAGTVELLRRGAEGLYHLVPSGDATWFAFARAIVEKLGAPAKLEAIRSSEYVDGVRRPAYSVLDNAKAARSLGRAPEHWQRLLEALP
jgi:dTDP-4-dehydrorhamnose reductase